MISAPNYRVRQECYFCWSSGTFTSALSLIDFGYKQSNYGLYNLAAKPPFLVLYNRTTTMSDFQRGAELHPIA